MLQEAGDEVFLVVLVDEAGWVGDNEEVEEYAQLRQNILGENMPAKGMDTVVDNDLVLEHAERATLHGARCHCRSGKLVVGGKKAIVEANNPILGADHVIVRNGTH